MNVDLKNKVTVITGAAQGIGADIARFFGKEGARLALTDIEEEKLEAVAREIRRDGGEVLAVPGDVSRPESVEACVRKIMEHYRRIDCLLNIAGICIAVPAEDVTYENWQKEFDVNVTGEFLWAQAVAKASMIPGGGGAIVNFSAGSGLGAVLDQLSYVASKHAVVGMTKELAMEWGRFGIRTNCLTPGITSTAMTDQVERQDPEKIAARKKRIPLGKPCLPIELARVCAFLVSDCASHINGLIMPVDGGTSAMYPGTSLPEKYRFNGVDVPAEI